ncbi:RluA family pseudouridine synthase [Gracilinema caldarium]|uniref:Pseudouridine synthase n=1 Tax=Gracilinema caldarium (strain ATCC 51460 / DSM 7334 / H1) TaxID=744872 RepID=F8EXD7_GRAC1|nr:RNA pseudouridine synthase [Gracilinema caldarium]AEJ19164.1 pseudouridine synthase [Gracilinema caldarium DSM 7334]
MNISNNKLNVSTIPSALPVPTMPPVLYESPSCIVLNKSCGQAVEGASGSVLDLPALLKDTYGTVVNREGNPFSPTAVHRLDVPVTGCALFARTPQALAFLNDCFAQALARKTYWAIVEKQGVSVLAQEGELVHWIAVDNRHNKSYAHAEEGPQRKQAKLRYRIVGEGDHYIFLEIELITGRHHQIRAQLAAIGLHIKGDLKYGSRRSEKNGGIRLHARSLAFPDPDHLDNLDSSSDAVRTHDARALNPSTVHATELPRPYIQVVAPIIEPDRLWLAFKQAVGQN